MDMICLIDSKQIRVKAFKDYQKKLQKEWLRI
jgi:hypothetical protein